MSEFDQLAAAGDALAHQLLFSEHSELLLRWWKLRRGECTVCMVEEGERHLSDRHEQHIQERLNRIDDSLRHALRLMREQTVLLHKILEREPKPTYPRPTGVSITVE